MSIFVRGRNELFDLIGILKCILVRHAKFPKLETRTLTGDTGCADPGGVVVMLLDSNCSIDLFTGIPTKLHFSSKTSSRLSPEVNVAEELCRFCEQISRAIFSDA